MADDDPREGFNVHEFPFPVHLPPGAVVSGIAVAVRIEHPERTGHGVICTVQGLEPIEVIGLFEAAKLKVYMDTRPTEANPNAF